MKENRTTSLAKVYHYNPLLEEYRDNCIYAYQVEAIPSVITPGYRSITHQIKPLIFLVDYKDKI